MQSDRRNFLKTTLLSTGVLATGMSGTASAFELNTITGFLGKKLSKQQFNMCGYAAPKMDKVRIGLIGLGARGTAALKRLSCIENVEITALCDQYEDRVERSQKIIEEKGFSRAKGYSGSKEIWKSLCENPDIDLVYIVTPWAWHAQMAVCAMEYGKHAATEVPAAKTIDECWQLVETSERTRKYCMMLENCCYDFFELQVLNMAQQGFFGEIIHGEGTYIHFNCPGYFKKDGYAEMWRLKEETRNGNIYPTHGMGPVCQVMNINRGDKMEYMVSMQSADFIMAAKINQLASEDPFYKEFAGKSYRGTINTTIVRTSKGRTIMSQHDVASPRPYSRSYLISGTKGTAQKWPLPERISTGHDWLKEDKMNKLKEQYTPEIVKRVGEMAKKVGGHGGMDFIMDWRLIYCLRNGLPLDQDVYDAASWSSIAPLSEQSVANRSAPVDIPDFTRGAWKTNVPVDLTLKA
ncbi:MAG: Gfo/Idh/MocA family oxidoreductase [Kiritimatiellae bacterium]|nr:Gfo/Idh/MocA family oxidoreductase [Kiritimatiellia bacterium]MDD5522487.1 Gfo/Idh/MocA family oxidoreductase [Kiritimatiellia bacterium]